MVLATSALASRAGRRANLRRVAERHHHGRQGVIVVLHCGVDGRVARPRLVASLSVHVHHTRRHEKAGEQLAWDSDWLWTHRRQRRLAHRRDRAAPPSGLALVIS